MKKLVILALATAVSSSFAFAADNDNAAYKAMKDKAASEYKVAKDKCDALSANAKDVCQEEAKLARAKTEHDAVAQHRSGNARDVQKAREKVADAEYEVAKEKCDDLSGSAKNSCQSEAKATKASAIADIRRSAGDSSRTAAVLSDRSTAGSSTAGATASGAADTVRDKTSAAGEVVADTVITTKVKADLAADPAVKAMDVHVETVKGVVMLSGFVPSKAEADKAVQLARGVKGVTDVKSSIQVK